MNFILPEESLLQQYTLCHELKDRRLSRNMREYDFPEFGSLTLVQNVELAIMSLDLHFVKHYMCSDITKKFVEKTLVHYFSNLKVTDNVWLIDPTYLVAFLALPATQTETFLRKFTRLYRKAMLDQMEWMYSIFKNSPQHAVNHALHNFIMGETTRRICIAGPSCQTCAQQERQGEHIFWFIRSGFDFSILLLLVL
jgi:hypothetical protein